MTKNLISLYDLGYTADFENSKNNEFAVARITSEHKERYTVKNQDGEFEAEILGNLRFSAESRLHFPAVGDWVSISVYDKEKALIHNILDRKNILKRQAAGKDKDEQIIAANIDYAFVVEAVNRDFNINRFERYLTICYDAQIEPILILNKTDLIDNAVLEELKHEVKKRIPNVDLLTISCLNKKGIENLQTKIIAGKTYCFLGSSGVGKSTIINSLSNSELMKTTRISKNIDRGKHTTSHRQLLVLEKGGVLIDNPGMREVGITNMKDGLTQGFSDIHAFAENCQFSDCVHEHEKGCAVIEAVENGGLSEESYKNYLKMKREQEHYEDSEAEKRRKSKTLSKIIRKVNKNRTH